MAPLGLCLGSILVLCIVIDTTFSSAGVKYLPPVAPQKVYYGSLDANAVKSLFNEFTREYGKRYENLKEKEERLRIFSENLKRYDAMNAEEQGTAVYGIDEFSDMTVEEFSNKMLTLNINSYKKRLGEKYDDPSLKHVKAPKNFDWREKGGVTPIKDQGACGSCWAFSTVANIEGLYFNKYKKLVNLSEQQLVDCEKNSDGCRGGWMASAVEYLAEAGGLQDEDSYPYMAVDQVCQFDKTKVVAEVEKNVMLPTNEKKMMAYLFKNGPISIALDARAMGGYKGGIAHPTEKWCSKNSTQVNHGIALVGYGVKVVQFGDKKKRIPYWIAKNSWGTEKCDKGYWYVYRGDNVCGLANWPSSAVLK
nr:PREDICTED: cathepsin L1-like [Bemisia tabaci]